MSAGGKNTLYVKTDGTLWAMGNNSLGQLGDGTTTDRRMPIQVASGVASVSAGWHYTLYVKMSGTLWAVGYNGLGQLGDGTTTNRSTPVQIDSGVASVSAGGDHTLYVKTDGTLWAMGYNRYGQLGDGTTTDLSAPVQVAIGVASISAGDDHSLFLLNAALASPVITAQPSPATVTTTSTAQFTVAATSPLSLTYQWQVSTDGGTTWANVSDGTAYSGSTTASLTVQKPTAVMKGYQYRCQVFDGINPSISSNGVTLTVTWSQFSALSARAPAGTGEQTLILGFVYAGGGKPTLVRGVGPAMSETVSGYLRDPQLIVYSGGMEVANNDNWAGGSELSDVFARIGAGALDPASKDAALYRSLTGNVYTAHVSGVGGTTGVALAEAYDGNLGDKTKWLTALSVRNQVGVDDGILIAGFVIAGDSPKQVIVRGVGPGISTVSGYLRDPYLQVWKLNRSAVPAKWELVEENDDWDHTSATAALFKAVGMGELSNDSKDAASVLTLDPGIYTAQVSGVGRTTGVGLVEIYEAP